MKKLRSYLTILLLLTTTIVIHPSSKKIESRDSIESKIAMHQLTMEKYNENLNYYLAHGCNFSIAEPEAAKNFYTYSPSKKSKKTDNYTDLDFENIDFGIYDPIDMTTLDALFHPKKAPATLKK